LPWEVILGAVGIFALRIVDVSIGTVKLLYMMRGQRLTTSILAFFESLVWLIAAGLVFNQLDNFWNAAGFTLGFAAGTATGMTIERWIGEGHALIRIVSREPEVDWPAVLREQGFGLTALQGRGSEGDVRVIIVVTSRKRIDKALSLIEKLEPTAFVTVDPISYASGGVLKHPVAAATVLK